MFYCVVVIDVLDGLCSVFCAPFLFCVLYPFHSVFVYILSKGHSVPNSCVMTGGGNIKIAGVSLWAALNAEALCGPVREMERVFLLLLLFFSSGLCAGNSANLGTGSSLAVCQPDTCALIGELAATREKLAAVTQKQSTLEDSLGDVMRKMADVEANLQLFKREAGELKETNRDQDEQLKALKEITSVSQVKVAFSAALGGSVGPLPLNTPLRYQRIISNIGSAYNPATGTFTARVRGAYYFQYTMYNNNVGKPNSVVSLMMNGERVVSTWDTEGDDVHDSATNAAVVKLEAGDSVFVTLYANRLVYDDSNYYNTFSGFLLFAM